MLAIHSAIREKHPALHERADTGVRPYTMICEIQSAADVGFSAHLDRLHSEQREAGPSEKRIGTPA